MHLLKTYLSLTRIKLSINAKNLWIICNILTNLYLKNFCIINIENKRIKSILLIIKYV